MKKSILFLIAVLLLISINSLNAFPPLDTDEEKGYGPEGFSYQAIARDYNGNPISSKEISVRVSLMNGEEGDFVTYVETHLVKTDEFGQFSIIIGRGTVINGSFLTVPWGKGNQWMQMEIFI